MRGYRGGAQRRSARLQHRVHDVRPADPGSRARTPRATTGSCGRTIGVATPCPAALPACRRVLLLAFVATTAITGLRLLGEVQRWSDTWFARDAGGGGGLVGIGWLIPVVGFLLGSTLTRAGHAPASRRHAVKWFGLGLLGVAITFPIAKFVLPVTVGTFVFTLAALAVCSLCACVAWPALARMLLVHALLARVPILGVTVVAVANDLGTHYEKLAPGSPSLSDAARTFTLCAAQLGIWVPLTLLVGGLAGALAASSAARTQP